MIGHRPFPAVLAVALAVAPARGGLLATPAAAPGCPSAAHLPPDAVLFAPLPPRPAAAALPALSPAATVLRLLAESAEVERRYDDSGLPFQSDVCGKGRDRAACLRALLHVEEAVEDRAARDAALHRALRALYLDGGEERLDEATRAELRSALALWAQERREQIDRNAKRSGFFLCIFPAHDVVDDVYIRAFTRRAVGDHHRVGSFALLNMRFGAGFAPTWRPDHPPSRRYC